MISLDVALDGLSQEPPLDTNVTVFVTNSTATFYQDHRLEYRLLTVHACPIRFTEAILLLV